jgi:antitoxin (DNA-binding transcriptional repressor) of toxin-antitoxin stability system
MTEAPNMAKSISATEAVRRFSDLLGTIKFRGARYTIVRGGKPIATLGPAAPAASERKLSDLREILTRIPRLGRESEAFERDLRLSAVRQPHLPAGDVWE